MNTESFHQLLSPAGQDLLAHVVTREPTEKTFLRVFTALEKHHPPALLKLAIEVAIARRRGHAKFGELSSKLYFTREALEQASALVVSRHRAQRFRESSAIFDLACGCGGDALSLARLAPTWGVDCDPLRLAMASANTRVVGGSFSAIATELASQLSLTVPPDSAVFVDPARRHNERRARSVADYQPNLTTILRWRRQFNGMGIKLSPAVDRAEVNLPGSELEFISVNGELREGVLWLDELAATAPDGVQSRRRATIIRETAPGDPASATVVTRVGNPDVILPLTLPKDYLFEPDAAVMRAELVTPIGERYNCTQLDRTIAYLTADDATPAPEGKWWRILDAFPFNRKKLKRYLRERGVGTVTIKKRGSAVDVAALARELKLQGNNSATLVITKVAGKPHVLLVEQAD